MVTEAALVLTQNEYDLYTLEALWAELQRAPEGREVVLDFRNVRYIDGASLGVLVKYAKAVKRRYDTRVHIVSANALIERILRITSLDRVFDVARPAV